jgi:hypothetical protein
VLLGQQAPAGPVERDPDVLLVAGWDLDLRLADVDDLGAVFDALRTRCGRDF